MPRGRPRKFDEATALNGAMRLFWERGLTATSLDDLAAAMEMNRPSIYNAFGDKQAIYLRALDRFCEQLDEGIAETLEAEQSLVAALNAFFRRALDVYCGTTPSLGCFMVCTAPAEAFNYPEVGRGLSELMARLDMAFARRLRKARKAGELGARVNIAQSSQMLQATLQTIALRARAGAARGELEKLSQYAVDRLTE